VNTTLAYSSGVRDAFQSFLIVGDKKGLAVICPETAYQHGCRPPHYALWLYGNLALDPANRRVQIMLLRRRVRQELTQLVTLHDLLNMVMRT
jgi:hypothetical protein